MEIFIQLFFLYISVLNHGDRVRVIVINPTLLPVFPVTRTKLNWSPLTAHDIILIAPAHH